MDPNAKPVRPQAPSWRVCRQPRSLPWWWTFPPIRAYFPEIKQARVLRQRGRARCAPVRETCCSAFRYRATCRRPHALALHPRFPPFAVPGDPGVRAFTELERPRAETGVDVYYYAPKGREEDTRRSLGRTPEMLDFFSRRIGVPYPPPALQPGLRARLHLRRHGEHHGHHAHLRGLARPAGRSRPRRRVPGVPRAGPSVVGRSAHLPRMARGLAE